MGVCNAYTQQLTDYKQGKMKQYSIIHCVSDIIHATMVGTLNQMASISLNNFNFDLWDKDQLVVVLRRTKNTKSSIFVGPKEKTLAAFRQLLLKRN